MRKQYIGIASFISVVCLAGSAAHANDPECEGKAGWYSTSCADPASNEIVVYADGNGGGKCMRFSSTFVDPVNSPGVPPGWIPVLGNYGFNDCISSVKVGSDVRLLAYQDAHFNQILPGRTLNWDWKMATYEPNFKSPWTAESTVNDDFSSLIVQDISQTNGERIPSRYIGSDPTSDDTAFWEMEPQGLCHNKTHWFITQELGIGDEPINPDFSCVYSEGLTGVVWKMPRDASLATSLFPPPGTTHRELRDIPDQFNQMSGYRHFGDPDCQTIAGNDYVFIPVQGCASNSGTMPLPYVLVLDSDLNFVAGWTLPSQPYTDITALATCLNIPLDANAYSNLMFSHGMGSWVAVRPSSAMTPTSVDVWMSTDICNGLGLQRYTGILALPGWPMWPGLSPPVITDFAGTPEAFQALQGGVFSPSGRTLYLATGDLNHLGGVRVIQPDTGQELTESGNNYGPFNFQQDENSFCLGGECVPTGQEPEGLDFLDTRCPGTPVATTGAAGQSSQLHVVMNHNGIYDTGDQVEVRHYSVADNEPDPMCEPMLFDSTSDPAISSQGGGTLDVFSIAGGRVFQRSYNNPGWAPTWTPLPAVESPRYLVGKPASVSWGPGRIDIFAHDDLGSIRHLWANSGWWAPTWETVAVSDLGYCYPNCSGLTAASWGVNRLDVFDTAFNGAGGTTIIQVTYDNGWNPPRRPFGDWPPVTGAISAVSWGPSRIDFVATPEYVGGDFYQIAQYYSNDGWNFWGPYPLGGIGSVFTMPTNVALSSWAYSDIEVVTMGDDWGSSIVGQRGFRPGLAWVDWTTSALSPEASPVWPNSLSSTSSGDGRIDIVYSRVDPTYSTTTVWHAWYNDSPPVGWFGPEPL